MSVCIDVCTYVCQIYVKIQPKVNFLNLFIRSQRSFDNTQNPIKTHILLKSGLKVNIFNIDLKGCHVDGRKTGHSITIKHYTAIKSIY